MIIDLENFVSYSTWKSSTKSFQGLWPEFLGCSGKNSSKSFQALWPDFLGCSDVSLCSAEQTTSEEASSVVFRPIDFYFFFKTYCL